MYIDDLELKVSMLCSYCPNPVMVIIDVEPKELGIPTKAYYAVEEVKEVSYSDTRSCSCVHQKIAHFLFIVFQVEPQQRRTICRFNWSSYNISAVHCLGCLFDGVHMSWLWDHIQDATQKSQKAFVHVASEIGAYEAEEIGMWYSPLQRVHDFCYASMKLVGCFCSRTENLKLWVAMTACCETIAMQSELFSIFAVWINNVNIVSGIGEDHFCMIM